MPKSSPPQKQNKPGNTFFAVAISIGVVALAVLWYFEKPSRPVAKTAANKISPHSVTRSASTTGIQVMTKSNLASGRLTNIIQTLSAKPQAVAPTVLPRTNSIYTNATMSPTFQPRAVQNVFEAQLALARQGISSGSIDGAIGSQTRAALLAFQTRENLPTTGELDAATKSKLLLTTPAYGEFFVTSNELARLQPLGTNWLSKSQQTRLDYETLLELVAERSCCSPGFIKLLNPTMNWTNPAPGIALRVPLVEKPKPTATAALVRVNLSAKNLKVYDAESNLIAHFPCSIARNVEKRPVGKLFIEKIATDPDYTFNPENFPESPEARSLKTKLILSPGPNNPVGTVWIGLNKPGYGIHGTPKPEEVGRTESHGCFRLANWNAEYLVRLVSIGTPVLVEP